MWLPFPKPSKNGETLVMAVMKGKSERYRTKSGSSEKEEIRGSANPAVSAAYLNKRTHLTKNSYAIFCR